MSLLSNEEREILITEIHNRMKDMIYMKGSYHAEKFLSGIEGDLIPEKGESDVTIYFNYTFKINDFLQILGRIRRKDQQ